MRLDRNSPSPLYHQLEVILRSRILSGEWPAGMQLPSETHLCELYGVSRVTVRQALRNLSGDGYIGRYRGRGTFVRELVLTAGERGLQSFSEEMQALGLTAGAMVLGMTAEAADDTVADRLELSPGEQVVRLTRLRTGDGKPIGVQTSYLPLRRFPGLAEMDLADRSLYQLLLERFDVVLQEAHETFWTTTVSGEDARVLSVAEGTSAFRVERLSFDRNGPFEFAASLMRGDRYRIRWILRNPTAGQQDQNLRTARSGSGRKKGSKS